MNLFLVVQVVRVQWNKSAFEKMCGCRVSVAVVAKSVVMSSTCKVKINDMSFELEIIL